MLASAGSSGPFGERVRKGGSHDGSLVVTMSKTGSTPGGSLGWLVAVLSVAATAALAGGLWAWFDESDVAVPSSDGQVLGEPFEDEQRDHLVDVERDEPVELSVLDDEPASFEMWIRQRRYGADAAQPGREVVAGVEGRYAIEGRGDVRVVDYRLHDEGANILRGGQRFDERLVGAVARSLGDASFRRSFDERGHLVGWTWPVEEGASGGPFADLVAAAVEVSTPRMPAESVLVGETWHYEPVRSPAPESPPIDEGVEVEVRETLRRVVVDERRDVELAVLDRELDLSGRPIVDGPPVLELTGRGRALVELDSGRLLSSTLEVQETDGSVGEDDRGVSSETEIRWRADQW